MKNRIFAFNDAVSFERELAQFSNWCKENGSPTVFFQIHSEEQDPEKLKSVWSILERFFPNAPWFGGSTSGNIVDCEKASEISISAIIIERKKSLTHGQSVPNLSVRLFQKIYQRHRPGNFRKDVANPLGKSHRNLPLYTAVFDDASL